MVRVLPFLLIAPGMTAVQAQAQRPPSRGEAMAAMNATPQQAGAQYSRQQIDQLIAPIALYPDQLLAQVLMAATYPQQLLEAADWLRDPPHAALQGEALAEALEPLPWDPSVKALAAFPAVIAMMTEHLEWTEALGLAFATQQAQVMQRVQALRQLAVQSGRIRNVKHVTVQRDADVIRIVSAEPDRVFVPVYNPTVVYGQWPDRYYPPIYVAPPPPFMAGPREAIVETAVPGFQVYSYPVVAPLWGWSRPDWRSSQIAIRTDEYTRITRDVRPPPDNRWRHQGPVVIVSPSTERTANRSPVQVPAGTVAPAQAAAVTALPQQAERHGDRVRVEQSGAPAGSAASGSNAAEARQPGQSQGQPQAGQTGQAGSNQTGKTQPESSQSGKTQAEQAQTDKAQPEKAQADKEQAARAQAEKAQTNKAQAEKAQTEKAQADKAQAEKAQAAKAQAEKAQAEKAQAAKAQAEKAQADKARAAEKSQAEKSQAGKAQAENAQAAKARAEKTQTDKAQAEKTQAEKAQTDKAQAEKAQAEKMQSEQARAAKAQAEKAQAEKAQADKAAAASARQQQMRTPSHQAAGSETQPAARPSHAGPAASPSAEAPRRAPAGETRAQGSSMPPSSAEAQRGHGHAAGQSPAHPDGDQRQSDNQNR
ncbi:MAG: DUF3300 domain-containing protein [Alphaproteobacteria bacterium]